MGGIAVVVVNGMKKPYHAHENQNPTRNNYKFYPKVSLIITKVIILRITY